MLSNKARYALRALLALAEAAPGSASITTLSERTGAPRKFLEAILLELNRAGLLESRRGRAGGPAGRPGRPERVGAVGRAASAAAS